MWEQQKLCPKQYPRGGAAMAKNPLGNKDGSQEGLVKTDSNETAVLFGKFVLVGKHSIAAIDVLLGDLVIGQGHRL